MELATHPLAFPILSLVVGLLILVFPRLLNLIVGIYLIIIGVMGLFNYFKG